MIIQEIKKLAKQKGLNPGKQKKADLIKAIQRQEGNFDCFATAHSGICDQLQCMWREDCFKSAKKPQH